MTNMYVEEGKRKKEKTFLISIKDCMH